MDIRRPLMFDIDKIYTLIHKCENENFCYECRSRMWDGFVIITDGECIFSKENTPDTRLTKGNIVFLRRDEKYTISATKPISYYTSAYDFSKESDETILLLPKISVCDALQMKMIEQITESWQRQSADSYMFCKIQLMKFYYEILHIETNNKFCSPNASVDSAIEFIHNNFKHNFKTSEISAYCSLSESHLRKKFVEETGMTIWQYRDMLRLKCAKELLSSGLFSVKETAHELGFCDVYYFTKFFLRYAKITPAKFKCRFTDNNK